MSFPLSVRTTYSKTILRGIRSICFWPSAQAQISKSAARFFPKTEKDYTEGQPRYTLLKKEKKNLKTGETEIQFDRLSLKKGE